MACNHADYLERTIKSISKYHSSVTIKFPVFVSQDGSNSDVRKMAMGYDQLTYMQHLDFEPVHTERLGELIAYYKIAPYFHVTTSGHWINCSTNIILIGSSYLKMIWRLLLIFLITLGLE